MQGLRAEDFSTDEESESGEKDMAEQAEESEMAEWGREGAQPRSGEDVAEDIRRTLLHKRPQVLSPAALAEQGKKSHPTCKFHVEPPTVQQPPPPPPTAQAITIKLTFPCKLCGNYEHVGTDCPEKFHSTNSLRHCRNRQETGHYSILCTKPSSPQPPNNLNDIQCDLCFGHHYGSQCNKKKQGTSVKYPYRTKNAIRTCHNLSPIPKDRNQADPNIAQWLHDTTTLDAYPREIGNEGAWEQL